MFTTLSNSWKLVKASYAVLRADRELLLFPLISMIGMIIVTLVFSIPLMLSGLLNTASQGEQTSSSQSILGWVLLFLFYLVMYTIVIFSNVALVGAAMIRLRGGDPTVNDGFRIARQHIRAILGYAAISATVGVVLSVLRNENNIIGKIIASVLNFAWNVVTFLVIPVLVVEEVGPIEAIKRSGNLLRKTWGEQLVSNAGIGIVFGLIMLALVLVVGVPLFVLAITANSVVLIVGAVAVTILLIAIVGLFSSALNGVFQAALYMYATTGDMKTQTASGNAVQYFEPELLSNAFRQKGSRR